MCTNSKIIHKVDDNFSKLNLFLFVIPLSLLALFLVFIYSQNAFSTKNYIQIQKEYFFKMNHFLGKYPQMEYNFTQFGDAIVFMSILSVFFIYAPKIWEALLSASFISCLFCGVSKKIFSVPRPAAIFNHDSIIIVGKTLLGHNSLPSGHSITIFTLLTIFFYAFMPKKITYKITWVISFLTIGTVLVFTRVGVGAHYPFDVFIGSIIGYISGLLGIFISRKYKIWSWINNPNYYPFFILLFIISIIVLLCKILHENLIIFYFPLVSLFLSLYIMIRIYVKKRSKISLFFGNY